MKASNRRVVSFITCFALILTMCLVPVPAAAAGETGVVFSDGDRDQVYFSGDTLEFNLTSIPGITADTPARIVFGIAGPMTFDPVDVITGLSSGAADGMANYADVTILSAGGTFSAPVSGAIADGLSVGAISVQLFIDTNGPNPGGWQNLLDLASASPNYIPLTNSDSEPALVGVDTVLESQDVICTPALGSPAQSDEDLYDLAIKFTKEIQSGVSGSISFTHLNFFDGAYKLQGLEEGLRMNTTAPGVGMEEAFTLGIDSGVLDFLDQSATISVQSASFSGLSADDFTAEALDVGDTAGSPTISGDTVSFTVNGFSDYKLSRGSSGNALDLNSDGYRDSDVTAIAAFLNQASTSTGGISNGAVLSSGYLATSPSSFYGVT